MVCPTFGCVATKQDNGLTFVDVKGVKVSLNKKNNSTEIEQPLLLELRTKLKRVHLCCRFTSVTRERNALQTGAVITLTNARAFKRRHVKKGQQRGRSCVGRCFHISTFETKPASKPVTPWAHTMTDAFPRVSDNHSSTDAGAVFMQNSQHLSNMRVVPIMNSKHTLHKRAVIMYRLGTSSHKRSQMRVLTARFIYLAVYVDSG